MEFINNLGRRISLLIKGLTLFKDWPIWLAYRFHIEELKPKGAGIFRFRDGVVFNLDYSRSQPGVFQEIWLMDLYQKHYKIKPGDIVLDIGAHIGAFAVLAASRGAKVFAFEPTLRSFEFLVKNSEEYGIKPFNIAVADKSGEVKMFEARGGDEGNSVLSEGSSGAFSMAKAVTLEEVFEVLKLEKCDLLKIDAEGAEVSILKNTPPHVWLKIHNVAMEYHKNLREVQDILKRNGFEIQETQGGEFGYVWARRI